MPVLNIPKGQYVSLRRLSELSPEKFEALLKALESAQPSLDVDKFAQRLSEQLNVIPARELRGYILMLYGLLPAKEANRKSAADVASDIRETLEDEMPAGFTKENISSIEERMKGLLGIEKGIAASAKAMHLITEHQSVFCGSKIYSDIRPIFSTDADAVTGATVLHSLNISYHDGAEHKEFYAAMDTDDLNDLKRTIEGARKRPDSCRPLYRNLALIS